MRLKCNNCGLVNSSQDSSCKRCKAALLQLLECHNVWRDGKNLVVNLSAHILPQRCLKCGTADYVDKFVLELTHTPLLSFITVFMSFTYWSEIDLHGFFCSTHRRYAQRQPFRDLPTILLVAGPCAIFVSFLGGDPPFRLLMFCIGAILLTGGILFMRAARGALKIVKKKRDNIWIEGVDQNLLTQLEPFPR